MRCPNCGSEMELTIVRRLAPQESTYGKLRWVCPSCGYKGESF